MRRNSTYERVMVTIVALILLTLTGLALRAMIWPSMEYSAEVQIDASGDKIWEMMTDPRQRIRWQRGLVDIVPLIEGDLMLGARNLVLFQVAGERLEIEEEVVEYQPPNTIHLAQASDASAKVLRYELEGGDSPTVRLSVQQTPSSFARRFVAPLYYLREQGYAQGMLERLKELSEEQ